MINVLIESASKDSLDISGETELGLEKTEEQMTNKIPTAITTHTKPTIRPIKILRWYFLSGVLRSPSFKSLKYSRKLSSVIEDQATC